MSGSSEKTEKSDKKAAKSTGIQQPTGATDLRARVPGMTDDALATLQSNARRMLETGNNAQRNMATDLIPVIESELADRKAKKLAAHPPRKTATPKVRKVKAVKEAKEDSGE